MFYYTCPQCGIVTATLIEGVCDFCRDENQRALDNFNSDYDRWEKLSNEERDREIKNACYSELV